MAAQPDHWLDTSACTTLPALFAQRVARTPDALAYRFYTPGRQCWVELTWRETAERVAAWRAVLAAAGVGAGDRVAVMLRNSPEWLCVDQAVLSLGAVTVGLYCTDTPGNNATIIDDSGACVLVAVKQRWISAVLERSACAQVSAIFVFSGMDADVDARMGDAEQALRGGARDPGVAEITAQTLASLVYAPGTSAQPRASMMTHANLAWCAAASARALPALAHDHAVSYLPLANSYERVVDVYRAIITGATVTFVRHPRFLNRTLSRIDATSLVAVPRVFELFYLELQRRLKRGSRLRRRLVAVTVQMGNAVFEARQGRARRRLHHLLWPLLRVTVARHCLQRLGGSLEYAVSAGAALPHPVAYTLIGLGVPLLQGYGMTEAGPLVSLNRLDDNDPGSVGRILDDVEIRIGPDNELLLRSPGVMAGYWHDDAATQRAIAAGGWLRTGDKVSRLDKQHLYLTGRIKNVIALTTGGKALPEPLERALRADPWVDDVVVVGEARPALAAVINCSPQALAAILEELGLDAERDERHVRLENYFLQRFECLLAQFPAHAQIRHVCVTTQPWTQANGLLDEHGRVRRRAVARYYARDIARLFGHRAGSEKTDASHNTNLG